DEVAGFKRVGVLRIQVRVSLEKIAGIRKVGEWKQLPEMRTVNALAIAQLKRFVLLNLIPKVDTGEQIKVGAGIPVVCLRQFSEDVGIFATNTGLHGELVKLVACHQVTRMNTLRIE